MAWFVSLIEGFLVVWTHAHATNPTSGPSHCDFFQASFEPYVVAIAAAAIIAPRQYRLAAIAFATVLSLAVTFGEFYAAAPTANPPIAPQGVPAAALQNIREACFTP